MSRFAEDMDSEAGLGAINAELGDPVDLRDPRTNTTYEDVPAIVVEDVGAVDPFVERTFTIRISDIEALNPSDPPVIRNGWNVVSQGVRWTVIKIRDAEDGSYEIRTRTPELDT